MTTTLDELTVGLGGFGAIGGALARRLGRGVPGLRLVAVSAKDVARAERRLADLEARVPVVPLAALADLADVVVECAPAAVFRTVAEPALAAGRILVPVSAGQLLEHADLIDLAERSGARIIVPTGALLGLDAVRAAAEGEIHAVTMVTRKPPAGLAGAPYLERHGIDLKGLTEARKVFEGSAREGARGFPANVNSRRRSVSPASAPSARGSRSGPTLSSPATSTGSWSRPTARASSCRSRTCRRLRTRAPAGSPRSRCSPRCAA